MRPPHARDRIEPCVPDRLLAGCCLRPATATRTVSVAAAAVDEADDGSITAAECFALCQDFTAVVSVDAAECTFGGRIRGTCTGTVYDMCR